MQNLFEWLFPTTDPCETPCCKELIDMAISGIYPTDEQLEKMLDYLERTP